MPEPILVQGRDYYMEDGRFVLTAFFLEQRGYCCKNGCRHCPYGFRQQNEKATLENKPESGEEIPEVDKG
jgi:hypothetical protein